MEKQRGSHEILTDDNDRETLILKQPTLGELTTHLCAILLAEIPQSFEQAQTAWEQTSYFAANSAELTAQRALKRRIKKDPVLLVQKLCKVLLLAGRYDAAAITAIDTYDSTCYKLEVFESSKAQNIHPLYDTYDQMVAEIMQQESKLFFTRQQIQVHRPDNNDPLWSTMEHAQVMDDAGVSAHVELFAYL